MFIIFQPETNIFLLLVVSIEIEFGALVVTMELKCTALETKVPKTSMVSNLKKENTLLNKDLDEERRLKDGDNTKGQDVVAKGAQCFFRLTKVVEANKILLTKKGRRNRPSKLPPIM